MRRRRRDSESERGIRPRRLVKVGSVSFGDGLVFIAGPCAVEGERQMLETARAVKAAGADVLRGGVFKTRTSPYSFQGLGERGLRMLEKARDETGLPFVTEVLDPRDVRKVAESADVLQVGARNMHNFPLLRECAKSERPVLLKRGMHSTIEEWLDCADFLSAEGNEGVILCERGIRTHENYTRNTLDLSAVAAAKQLSAYPVIADPSHGTGRAALVGPMCLAAVAAGADGLMVEVHWRPERAISDREQAITPEQFAGIVESARALRIHMEAEG